MATYQKKTHRVEAVKFTREDGRDVMAFQAHEENKGKTHPSGVAYVEGAGYNLQGRSVSFGDYVVRSAGVATVTPADEFEAAYERVAAPVAQPAAAEPVAEEAEPAKKSKKGGKS